MTSAEKKDVSDNQNAVTMPSLDMNRVGNTASKGKRRIKLIAGILILVALLVVLRLTVFAPKPVIVDVTRVERGSVELTVSNTRAGTVEARVRAHLSAETAGRVIEIPVREGDSVKEGQLLLRLDDSLQRARLQLAVEDVRAAAARAEEACLGADLAAKELARVLELSGAGIATDQQMDTATTERDRTRAACRAARATVDQARAQERFARAELELTELRAPFAGVLADRAIELGEWITPGPPGLALPTLLDVLDPTSLYVAAPIDEMDAARVRVGQEVRITVDSHRGEQFVGELVRVAPFVEDLVEQNRTVEIEVDFSNPDVVGRLLPGTSADVEVILDRHEDVLQIPTGSISDKDKVLVVIEDTLEERTVTTGVRNWRTTEILDGLSEGELIVTARDSTAIRAGAKVQIGEDS